MIIAVTLIVGLLLLLIQNVVYKKYWSRKLTVSIDFSDDTAFEGNQLFLNETIVNRKLLPLPWLMVKFQVSRNLYFDDTDNSSVTDLFYRYDLFSILMYQKINRRLKFVCGKRGVYVVTNADIVSSNIFITWKLAKQLANHTSLYVYPKLIEQDSLAIPYQRILGEILTKRFIVEDPFEFKGIREYQPYDSYKSVNWKASAKTGDLMVNVNDFTVSQEIKIVLNLYSDKMWNDNYLSESAIRVAASLATFYCDDGIPVSFYCNGKDLYTKDEISLLSGSSSEHKTSIYNALARIDLVQNISSIIPYLEEEKLNKKSDTLILIISPYAGDDLQDIFDDFIVGGFSAFWIIPKYINTEVKLKTAYEGNIYFWEVSLDER